MATCIPFQTQLTSIMEVLVKTAVAEISKLVDDKCGSLHLEISRTQNENEILKRKLLVIENKNAQMQRGFENYVDSGTDVGSSCPHPTGTIKFANTDQATPPFMVKEEAPDEDVWTRNSSESIGPAMEYSNTSAERHLLEEPSQLANTEFTNQNAPNHFDNSHNSRQHGEDTNDRQLTIKMEKEEGNSGLSRDGCQHGTAKHNPLPSDFSLDERENQLWSSIIDGNDIDAGFLDFSSVVEEYSNTFPNHSDAQTFPSHCKSNSVPQSTSKPPVKITYSGEYQKGVPQASTFQPRPQIAHSQQGGQSDHVYSPRNPQAQPHPRATNEHSERDAAASASSPAAGAHPHAGAFPPLDTGFHPRAGPTPTRGYICGLCGKSFPRLHQFKLHQQSHKRRRAFWCAVCGKSFQCSSHLNIHHRTHTGEKPYGCGQCGKRFTQQSSLRVHQRTHSGERPYSCAQCGKTFILLHHLKRHRIIHAYMSSASPQDPIGPKYPDISF